MPNKNTSSSVTNTEQSSSWFHTKMERRTRKNASQYDPHERNPLFAGGDKATYLELLKLSQHYHPSVALFAKSILQGNPIKYSGDPLEDFTLIRYLDRFAFKNPKKKLEEEQTVFSQRKHYTPRGARSLRVNTNAYLNQQERNIPSDELFLYE